MHYLDSHPASSLGQQSNNRGPVLNVEKGPVQHVGWQHRVDDRRTISGIVHMLRSGARWRDCPAGYEPYATVYNRCNQWSRQGIWLAMFAAMTGCSGVIGTAAIDSSHIEAHRSAGGGKGGPSSRRSVAHAAAGQQRSTR